MIVSDPSKFVRTGDLCHCTSLSFIGNMIRLREVNWQAWRMFDLSISTHTAIVYCEGHMRGVMEMMPDGKGKSALQFSPFYNYLNQGKGGDRIISITRHPWLDSVAVRGIYSAELVRLYNAGVQYDTDGCLKNAFNFLKDKKNEFYCCELAEYLAQYCAFSYWKARPDKNDNCVPLDLQNSAYMQMVLK